MWGVLKGFVREVVKEREGDGAEVEDRGRGRMGALTGEGLERSSSCRVRGMGLPLWKLKIKELRCT